MTWLNEHEVETAVRMFDTEDTPNLARAAQTLYMLVRWTNRNSDGWPYWSKPSRAAERLQTLLSERTRDYYRGRSVEDCTEAELVAALRPIKAFLTRCARERHGLYPNRPMVTPEERERILRSVTTPTTA